MASFGAYDVGTIEAENNITHLGGGCPGGASDWAINGSSCLITNVGGAANTILRNFGATITEGYLPDIVTVRLKSLGPFSGINITCQLWLNGSLIGDAVTIAAPGSPYDISFSEVVNSAGNGWNVNLSRADAESAQFGYKLSWAVVTADPIDGSTLTVVADPGWSKVDVYAEPAWQYVNARAESAFNTDAEFAEQAWRSINGQAVGR